MLKHNKHQVQNFQPNSHTLQQTPFGLPRYVTGFSKLGRLNATLASFSSRLHGARKDIVFLLLGVLPALLIICVAVLHTLSVLIFFGGAAVFKLVLPLVIIALVISLIVQRQAMHSLLSLMGIFLSMAGVYFSQGAAYFGGVSLIVSQGAVSILFLYALILLPLRALLGSANNIKTASQLIAAVIGAIGFVHILNDLHKAFDLFFKRNELFMSSLEKTTSSALREAVLEQNDILAFNELFTTASALFILLTLILLSAMLGSIILATSTTEK